MTVRITTTNDGERTVLQVAGRLQAVDVVDLSEAIDLIAVDCSLDLSQLQSADQSGLARLRELSAAGVELRGVSPYVQLLLDSRI